MAFVDCVFGGDSFSRGQHIQDGGTGVSSRVTVNRCTFYQGGNAVCFEQTSTGRAIIRDSDFIVTAATFSTSLISGVDGLNVHDCRFDAIAVTSGSIKYISYAPGAVWGGCVFTGNRFRSNGAVGPVALNNTATLGAQDCFEAGNYFGDPSGEVTPYAGSLGFYALGSSLLVSTHASRQGTTQAITSNNPTLTVSAEYCDMMIVSRTGAGAQTLNMNAGRIGDRFRLQVMNASGGSLTLTAGTNMLLDGLTGTFVANDGQSHIIEFMYAYTAGMTAAGWVQVAKGTDCG